LFIKYGGKTAVVHNVLGWKWGVEFGVSGCGEELPSFIIDGEVWGGFTNKIRSLISTYV